MATPEKPTKAEDSFLAKFEKELNNPANFFVPLLAKIEQLTNVKRIYLAYGINICLLVFVFNIVFIINLTVLNSKPHAAMSVDGLECVVAHQDS